VATDGATLTVEDDRTIEADRGRLHHVFENLFRNAVEHGSTGSRTQSDDTVEHGSTNGGQQTGRGVDVTVGFTDGTLYVADDGPGVDPDERDAIFESGYSTNEAGTGFGLPIVKDIVEAHGWDISVTDSEAGSARFEITGFDRERPSG